MIPAIQREVERRKITRICHFTPSRNLVHILTGTTGILATKKLELNERSVFTQTDVERLDRHENYICCSIEYPNLWYFDKAKSKDILFKEWVVLFINPEYLWLSGTRFCPRNAASAYGRSIGEGEEAFLAMFAPSITGAYGKTFTRLFAHLSCCPTDNQAEVLIPDQIGMNDILAIAVPTETQAKREATRLHILGVPEDSYNLLIAPDIFEKHTLSKLIRAGKRPKETPWTPRDEP
ncbi:DarT ssDNA thymidine ADP-ribosyltransferase family protein [Argonema antarcticum]|uniref:DarT ssDNA thymidine ADP-ribosyltransferase family protein n=1 Tax=Argonema antarcticum TaxID=2942763 RepID=UPI002012A2F7|nr:DarT ssDNA thymidine ADP-ribosyltransferase family protein [Argonema antarcticum]MCL1469648.1 DUF4433 domain-containing protein [Argonema antarcticum A004/B2]